MQVSNANDVKIYNLSVGKSLPEWLSDRKKRALLKSDGDLRKRIELIQDFTMPTVSTGIQMTPDSQYVIVTGTYKPRVRCYDMAQLSMKFERCMDAEVIKFVTLSEDYSKMVFLQCNRYIEFHARYGRYHQLRIPKFGRDVVYHKPSCDLFVVGASSEIFRINLEQGRFLSSWVTEASAINACAVNPAHHLLSVGTAEGRVECWDPRVRRRVGILDCALSSMTEDSDVNHIPSVTCLKFQDALHMAVGTSTGQVLMYDIRATKPLYIKDHQYGLPIKSIHFQDAMELVLSADNKVVKMWNRNTGKPFTSIETEHNINDMCLVPNSGLVLMANEAPTMLTYFVPSLGPAPRWCSFLDNLTEELEETTMNTVYDDYKFVTRNDLENLGLSHLIGSNLLRAYMHGYFMDIRLYHKARAIADPFAYEEYRRNKIREKIDEARKNRVRINKLPKVNRDIAARILDQDGVVANNKKAKAKIAAQKNLLSDDRFSAMFKDTNYQVDKESEEYRLLNPLLAHHDKQRLKRARKMELEQQFQEVQSQEKEGRPSDEEDDYADSSSDDDDRTWQEEVRQQHKAIQMERKMAAKSTPQPKFYELKPGEEFRVKGVDKERRKKAKTSLADRIKEDESQGIVTSTGNALGTRQVTFHLKKKLNKQRKLDSEAHHAERRKIRRSASGLVRKKRTGRRGGNG
ncbi:nucleolar protein 10-like [Anneissia japonica]|uniref:nucleolar protein 10-like n=1 Tax=Anneissia japonica TaxID=1529436 RepID=UPI0014259F6C|nr:nucleolar protein 10-like [Anneissia japonica]